jgi:hypothetical protein
MCTKGSFYLATEDTIKSHGFLDNLTIRLIVATCVYEPNATGEVKHEDPGRRGRPCLDFIKKKHISEYVKLVKPKQTIKINEH